MKKAGAKPEPEIPADPLAEAQAKAAAAKKRELLRASGRARAKRSYERRKRTNKGPAAKTSSAHGGDGFTEAPKAAPSSEGLAGVLSAEDDARGEEQGDGAAAGDGQSGIVFSGPDEVAKYLCELERLAQKMANLANPEKRPRLARVVAELHWRGADGKPTDECLFACTMMWPWIEQGGLAWLEEISPTLMAVAGACLLFGPAALTALDELEEHRAERARRAKDKTLSAVPTDRKEAAS